MSKNTEHIEEKEEDVKTEDLASGEISDTEREDVEMLAEDGLKQELADAKAKIEELQDKYLRQVAEFDNYRKRTLKEKTELILNGGEKIMNALLPVLDDFERAVKSFEGQTDVATLKEGVELIQQKLFKTLSAEGLSAIDTEDATFDTDFHEAIAMIPVDEATKKGKILDCVQTGYKLNDKVIRHAKVAVGQ